VRFLEEAERREACPGEEFEVVQYTREDVTRTLTLHRVTRARQKDPEEIA
jgi:hypothetical protein